MVNIKKSDIEALERMIDTYRVQGILQAIAMLCDKKAQQIRATWKDEPLAQTYESDARTVDVAWCNVSN